MVSCSCFSPRKIHDLDTELEQLYPTYRSIYIIGDLNIWHKKWLHYSPQNTVEGETLLQICYKYNLREIVRQPTRGPNLLDLVLTNSPALSSTRVIPAIADHSGVLTHIHLPTPSTTALHREVWCFKKANWNAICDRLSHVNWKEILGTRDDL